MVCIVFDSFLDNKLVQYLVWMSAGLLTSGNFPSWILSLQVFPTRHSRTVTQLQIVNVSPIQMVIYTCPLLTQVIRLMHHHSRACTTLYYTHTWATYNSSCINTVIPYSSMQLPRLLQSSLLYISSWAFHYRCKKAQAESFRKQLLQWDSSLNDQSLQ